MVAFFAVFGEVQTGGFDFLAGAQTDDGLDDISDDDRADDRQRQRQANRLELFEHQRLENLSVT